MTLQKCIMAFRIYVNCKIDALDDIIFTSCIERDLDNLYSNIVAMRLYQDCDYLIGLFICEIELNWRL